MNHETRDESLKGKWIVRIQAGLFFLACYLFAGTSWPGLQEGLAATNRETAAAVVKEESQEDLEPFLKPIRAKYDLPALTGGIVYGGRMVASGAVGVRSAKSDEKVTKADRWHLGSCTKAMTATLIARLVEKGEMSWDTTIGHSFPDLKEEIRPEWLGVTVEQLLSHRSGLPEDRKPDLRIFPLLRTVQGPMREQRLYLVKLVLKLKPDAPPGTRMQYANYGYAIAGAMAEKACGKSWEELMEAYLFKPLGMKSAGFGAPGDHKEITQPRGHMRGDPVEPGPFADNPAVIGPAGTLHCTLEDWGKFIALHIAGARGESDFLDPETFKKLHAPPPGGNYALGWVVTEREWAGGRTLTHSGSNGMWFAVVWLSPKKNFAVLAATNTGGAAAAKACDEVAGALIRHFLKNKD